MKAKRLLGMLAVSLGALAPPASGQRPAPVVHDVRLENPQALAHFYSALRALESGAERKVRVFHYGDSNVAADLWTGVTRRALQSEFASGGPGYVVPGFGSRFDPHLVLRQGGWHARRKGFARDFGPADGLWGLAGVAAEGGPGAWVEAEMPAMPDGGVFEVHALARRGGGILEARIDGGAPVMIRTQASSDGLVLQRFPLGPGKHTARLRVVGGRPVRLLGIVVEQDHPGVVYDVFGINGHRASAWLEWNEALLKQELAHRKPDLVVLSYGGNEALDPELGMDTYRRQLEQVVAEVQRLMPQASVLLVGPIPMCPVRPRVAKVAAIQRRIARRAGVAFWDSSRLSEPHASLCSWRMRRPALISSDGMHLSKEGYAIVGHEFTKALLAPLDPHFVFRH